MEHFPYVDNVGASSESNLFESFKDVSKYFYFITYYSLKLDLHIQALMICKFAYIH